MTQCIYFASQGLTDDKEEDDGPYGMTINRMVVDDRSRHSSDLVVQGHPQRENAELYSARDVVEQTKLKNERRAVVSFLCSTLHC